MWLLESLTTAACAIQYEAFKCLACDKPEAIAGLNLSRGGIKILNLCLNHQSVKVEPGRSRFIYTAFVQCALSTASMLFLVVVVVLFLLLLLVVVVVVF